MNYLLDTHIFLWFIEDNKKLAHLVKQEISNLNNNIFLSKATLWEIIIKTSIGKLELDKELDEIEKAIAFYNLILLDINFSHLKKLFLLEHYHRDPFDRMIIAQAISEDLIVISDDPFFKQYPVKLMKY